MSKSTDEQLAKPIFETAIKEGSCSELMNYLFEGGSATVDKSGKLILVTEDILKQLMEN